MLNDLSNNHKTSITTIVISFDNTGHLLKHCFVCARGDNTFTRLVCLHLSCWMLAALCPGAECAWHHSQTERFGQIAHMALCCFSEICLWPGHGQWSRSTLLCWFCVLAHRRPRLTQGANCKQGHRGFAVLSFCGASQAASHVYSMRSNSNMSSCFCAPPAWKLQHFWFHKPQT